MIFSDAGNNIWNDVWAPLAKSVHFGLTFQWVHNKHGPFDDRPAEGRLLVNGPFYMQAKSQPRADLSLGYFEHVRLDIEPLLPPSAELIVDVGAGTGRTAAW